LKSVYTAHIHNSVSDYIEITRQLNDTQTVGRSPADVRVSSEQHTVKVLQWKTTILSS